MARNKTIDDYELALILLGFIKDYGPTDDEDTLSSVKHLFKFLEKNSYDYDAQATEVLASMAWSEYQDELKQLWKDLRKKPKFKD